MAHIDSILQGSHGKSPEPCVPHNTSLETFCVHGYTPFVKDTGAVSTPLVLSATFHHPSLGKSTGFDYSRGLNPTRLELERTLASMEHGSYALAFSSGMAAVSCLVKLFNPNDEIIVSDDLYGGTWRIFSIYEKYGLTFHYVDTSDIHAIESVFTKHTRAIFLETPTNPMMHIADIQACAQLIHTQDNGLLIVDNTLLSPYYQNPLDLGADIVVHSGTKYLSGHHDCIAGFLVYKTLELDEFFRTMHMSEGAGLSPFDAWLVLRGIKTLPIRMEKASENAKHIATALRTMPQIETVFYPGFEDSPGRSIFEKQSRGNGSMLSFYVKKAEYVPHILKNLQIILFAESLGGVQTLITYPLTQTHNVIPEELRNKVGVTPRLLRLSVGIENAEELIQDLASALQIASKEA